MSKMFDFIKHAPINEIGAEEGNVALLFELIKSEQISTKDEIASLIYQREVSDVAIYDLMNKLENELINSIINYPPVKNKFKAIFLELQKINCVANILSHTGKKKQATYLAEKAIKKSILYEVTDITVSLANICKSYFARTGNEKRFQYYVDLYDETFELYKAEKKAEDIHYQLIFSQSKKKSFSEEDIHLVEHLFEETSLIKNEFESNRIYVLWASCGVVLSQMKNESESGIQICKECLNHLIPQADRIYSSYIFTFLFHMVPELVKQGKYVQALDYLGRCEVATKQQPFNAILVQQYQFIASMHAQDIEQAGQALDKLQTLKLNELQGELFEVHRAYHRLLTHQSIRLARLFNQVPTYSKDKEGMNINILIIQLLYLLREERYDIFCDRSPAVQRYLHRYLKGTPNKRSTYFLQALLELEAIGFDRKKIDKVKSIKKLVQYPYEESPQDFDIEVVRYEYLWERVVEWIKN